MLFSCYLWNIRETLRLAAAVKAARPGAYVVLGGPEVSYNAGEVLAENPQVDYILSGEGERSVPMLLASLAAGRKPEEAAPPIPGLCARGFLSAPCVEEGTPPSPYAPAYLENLRGRIAYLETSRGCPYACAFCLSGRCGKPRWFPLEQAKRNILTLARSGAHTVKFIDRTFNANPAHANAILAFILKHYGRDIPAGVCFHFELAGDILREETFALLEQAPPGAFQLEIGMQSFCEKTLAAVRRKTDTGVLKQNIRRLVAMGNMHVHIDLIAGLPHEDLRTFGESFNTGYALGAQMLQLGFLKLLHGAAMREEPEEFPCVFSEGPPYEVQKTPWLSPEELDVLRAAEDALERCYNSGRFLETAAYAMAAAGLSPFVFYCRLGAAGARHGEYSAGRLHRFFVQLVRGAAGHRQSLPAGRDGARPPCHKFHRAFAAMPACNGRFAGPRGEAAGTKPCHCAPARRAARRGAFVRHAAGGVCGLHTEKPRYRALSSAYPFN